MRIRIALTLLILMSLGQSNALPINKQVQNIETSSVAGRTETSVPVEPQPQESTAVVEAPVATPVVRVEIPPSQPVTCGDNTYANYIYMHESSCNVNAVNSIGCRGIGQACPGSKLPCGSDYECQNKWFTNYAVQRYGSWEQAYYFWLNNHWW
jgi:hypothetical protein